MCDKPDVLLTADQGMCANAKSHHSNTNYICHTDINSIYVEEFVTEWHKVNGCFVGYVCRLSTRKYVFLKQTFHTLTSLLNLFNSECKMQASQNCVIFKNVVILFLELNSSLDKFIASISYTLNTHN